MYDDSPVTLAKSASGRPSTIERLDSLVEALNMEITALEARLERALTPPSDRGDAPLAGIPVGPPSYFSVTVDRISDVVDRLSHLRARVDV